MPRKIIIALIFSVCTFSNAFSQKTDSLEFVRNYEILDHNSGDSISTDSLTMIPVQSAIRFMEMKTGIEAKPWVNFIFVYPYNSETFQKWEEWGIANGYLKDKQPFFME